MRSVIPIPLPKRKHRLPLTPRQEVVLAMIRAWHAVNGTWPTVRDLADAMEPPVNVYAIFEVMEVLRRKSYLACYGAGAMEIIK